MLFNTTFNNTSAKIVVVSFIGGGNRRKAPTCQTLSQNVVSCKSREEWGSNSQLSVVIGTDCIGSCKFNNHTIMTTMAPVYLCFGCLLPVYCVPNVTIVYSWLILPFSLTFIHKHIQLQSRYEIRYYISDCKMHETIYFLNSQENDCIFMHLIYIYRCKFKNSWAECDNAYLWELF